MVRYLSLSPDWKENDFLKKSEIKYFANSFLNNDPDFTCMRSMHPDMIYFLLKCITDLIQHHKCFKFTDRQKKDLVVILKPYRKKYEKIADCKKRTKHVKQIQSGRGLLISSLIAAVAPMVYGLIKKVVTSIRKGFKK